MISFGHAAFFGLGGYTMTIAFVKFGITPWIGIPLGMVVGVVAGIVIGYPTFRLRGHYFALSMLAYPLAMLYVFEWLGYQEVSLPMMRENPALYVQFSDIRVYMVLAMALTVICMIVSLHVERSRFGMSLLAIKQNEPAAEAAGINALGWKMRAMMVSAAMAAAAGGLYAVVLLVVTPQTMFGMLVSAQALIVALFGGVGTLWGPVIGAAVLVPLAERLHAELGHILPGIQGVVYGIAIIAIILLAPEGIYWRVRDSLGWRGGGACGKADAPRPRPALRRCRAMPGRQAQARRARQAHPAPRTAWSRAFGGLKAVDDVSITVAEGEIHGIIGPNGAGKTTLFNVINGFLAANAGSIEFAGTELTGLKPHQVCRLGVGRTFQVVRAFPRMTVLDNVIVGAYAGAHDTTRTRRLAPRRSSASGLRAIRRYGDRRRAHHQAAPAHGACARTGGAPAYPAARRDARGPRPRRARGHSGHHPAGQPRRRHHRHHRAYHAGHGEARRPFQRARPRQADRQRPAGRGGAQPGRDRGLSRQEMDGSCSKYGRLTSPTEACGR